MAVMVGVDGPQAGETDVERNQRAEQFAREFMLAGDLVVDKLEAAKPGDLDDLLDFLDDIVDRPGAIAALVEDRNFAERAAIRASAARLHRHRPEKVAVELEQFMARTRQVLQIV